MSRPMVITDNISKEAMASLKEMLKDKVGLCTEDNVLSWKYDWSSHFYYKQKAKLIIKSSALTKMQMLTMFFDTEVAWHGIVERGEKDNTFILNDIIVYPQKARATTVESDDEKYPLWSATLDDEIANKMFMQGHSHVDMSVSPSNTDLQHQAEVAKQIAKTGDGFYVFIIFNRRNTIYKKIYDAKHNVIYTNSDITAEISPDGDMADFLTSAQSLIIKE